VARLVAGHDREVACERELEQAEFDAIDDEGRRHRVSLGNPPHQLGAVAAFLKLAARRGNTDFSAETISAAMTGSGYSVELSAALLGRAEGRRPLRRHPGRGGGGRAGGMTAPRSRVCAVAEAT
jgi:hypothetical protein